MSELLEKIDPIDLNAITPPGQVCTELLDSAYIANSQLSSDKAPVSLLFSQWSDYSLRIKQQTRTDIIASHTEGMAIAIDNPGVSPSANPMDSKMRSALCEGNLAKVSKLQWDTIGEALDSKGRSFNDIERLIGYSMGSHLAVSAAKHAPGEVNLAQLDLLEIPGLDKKSNLSLSMARLALSFLAHGGTKLSETIASNPDWAAECRTESPLLLPKMIIQRPAGLWQYPLAIVHPHNNIVDDLLSAKHHSLNEAIITVTATDADKISPLKCNKQLVQQLGLAGMSVRGFEIMDSVHASQDNMAWWKGVLEQIDDRVGNRS